MTQNENQRIKNHTLHWIKSFVIELNLCPFAQHALSKLSVEVCHAPNQKSALVALKETVGDLDADGSIETSLLVFSTAFKDFFDYLDFADLAEQWLIDSQYEGIYQLATFHPHYFFDGIAFDDVTNYTNRSPYPMLHFLREKSLDKAMEYYGDTSQIPENNMQLLRELGTKKILAVTALK